MSKTVKMLLISRLVPGTAASTSASATGLRLVAGREKHVWQLLRLMDRDQNGRVSKEEFFQFVGAEFDRLKVYKGNTPRGNSFRLPLCIRIQVAEHVGNRPGRKRSPGGSFLQENRPPASPHSPAPERRALHCFQYLFQASFESFFFSSAASAFHSVRHLFSRASMAALSSLADGV